MARDAEADVSTLESNYAAITTLDMSSKKTSRYAISTGVLVDFTGLTSLNLSDTEITELGGLVGITTLTSLDISKNPISDLGALVDMSNLATLNVSNTNITDLNVLVKEGNATRFANLVNLQATNIATLNSIAGLVHVAINDVQSDAVTWNLDGSTLSSDTDGHINQINSAKDSATFNAPTVSGF